MITLQITLSNNMRLEDGRLKYGVPWSDRETVLISSSTKTIPELFVEAEKLVKARPHTYTCARVTGELLDSDGIVLGNYWTKSLDFAILESDGKIIFKEVNPYRKGGKR